MMAQHLAQEGSLHRTLIESIYCSECHLVTGHAVILYHEFCSLPVMIALIIEERNAEVTLGSWTAQFKVSLFLEQNANSFQL